DLQEISLAETSALQIRRQPTDLSALCADVVASHAPLHPGTSLRCEGSTVIASADPLRIRQVVENLVGNALTHTNGGGHVAVTVSQTPTSARIEVTDSGPGIATEDLPHVFDRFWRADSSRTRTTGGSGLGLSISKAIIDAHHGSLTVESEPGHGTTFIAELPVSDIAAQ
ncbi:MAG: sensor histidine kinase, partial [Acidimicrobiales bacterium]